ncbi:MAG: hypothetical protein WBF17_20300 [Phycisphaerae bacterium]
MADEHAQARFRGTGRADPVRVTNVRCSDGPVAGQSSVTFDLSWDHSWRARWEVSEKEHGGTGTLKLENWDAAWVFVKFRKPGAEGYAHATLSTNKADYGVPGGAALGVGQSGDGKRGLGVFIYRATAGHGPNDWKGVKLRWLHGADGVDDPRAADLKVFGIQMVYVPQCAFWAGDGATAPVAAQFSAGDTAEPFHVESEDALTLGGKSRKNLGNRDSLGVRLADGFTSVVTQVLPGQFPKGYAAFYCMRHEITQGQYADFLNTLSREQQLRLDKRSRKGPVTAGTPINTGCQAGEASKFRNGIKIAVLDVPGAGGKPGKPAVYETATPHVPHGAGHKHQITVTGGPHGGGNGVFYAAWAGLRPMAELEYEKACRGPLKPVPGEYAWGTNQIAGTNVQEPPHDGYSLRNVGKPDESVAWEGGNGPDATRGNAAWCGTIMRDPGQYRMYAANPIHGPLRVGIFATPESGRVAAGASYWGILELTGNLWEEVIVVGNLAGPWDEVRKNGRRFAGTHGDGTLAQPPGWEGLGQRGGAFDSHPMSVSHRPGHGYGSSGSRCVRTAP